MRHLLLALVAHNKIVRMWRCRRCRRSNIARGKTSTVRYGVVRCCVCRHGVGSDVVEAQGSPWTLSDCFLARVSPHQTTLINI